MWRRNTFPGNPDSDQSISDEEELQQDYPENCISLGGAVEKEGELQLPSRLEILRGTNEQIYGKKPSSYKACLADQKKIQFSQEDEVGLSVRQDDSNFIHSPRKELTPYSDDEMISDDDNENNVLSRHSITSWDRNLKNIDLHSVRSEKRNEAHILSAVGKEGEELVRASCSSINSAYSKANKSSKGARGRIKPKFSFRFQSHREERSTPSISKDGNIVSSNDQNDVLFKVHEAHQGLKVIQPKTMEHPIDESFEDFQEETKNQLEIYEVPVEVETYGHGYTEHSMAELLDGLQDKTGLLRGNPKLYTRSKGRREQLAIKRSTYTLGGRTSDNEDPPEPIGNGSSSDDEANYQKQNLAISEIKGKTMADRFQEALGSASLSSEGALFALPKTPVIGLFGKLQQVMQTEKERDADFLNELLNGASSNDAPSCIDVKIISRYLDAKLTVCRCSLSNSGELQRLQWPESSGTRENKGRDMTVIFNSRLCADIELEVGNLIRIHPPWKEVTAVCNDETVILSTYFSPSSMQDWQFSGKVSTGSVQFPPE